MNIERENLKKAELDGILNRDESPEEIRTALLEHFEKWEYTEIELAAMRDAVQHVINERTLGKDWFKRN